MKGGLEEVGNFKEGFCFRIKSQTLAIWNLCADTFKDKAKWMQAIKPLLKVKEVPVTLDQLE